MKVLGDGITTDQTKSVVFFDSHDIFYTWCRSRDMPDEIRIREWEFLLQRYPNSDVLYFPHPWETLWKSNKIREINKKYKNDRHIIFHAFLWDFNSIRESAKQLNYQYFDGVQFSPIQGIKGEGKEFWEYYQPLGLHFYQSPLGAKQEFVNMCKELKELGMYRIADIVLRHCAGNNKGELKPHWRVDEEIKRFVRYDIGECKDYNNRWEYTHKATGMPVLDFEDKEYQQLCVNFINELRELEINGIRLDQLKHYPVCKEGSNFLKNVFQQFEDSMYLYGEVIDCPTEINNLYVNNY